MKYMKCSLVKMLQTQSFLTDSKRELSMSVCLMLFCLSDFYLSEIKKKKIVRLGQIQKYSLTGLELEGPENKRWMKILD